MEITNYEKMDDLSKIFSALGEETRLMICIYLLENPTNVNDISNALNLAQPKVSHHLRILKDSKVVVCEKAGKNVVYKINDEHIEEIIKLGLIHTGC